MASRLLCRTRRGMPAIAQQAAAIGPHPLQPTRTRASQDRLATTARKVFGTPVADAPEGALRSSRLCRRRAPLEALFHLPRGEHRRQRGADHDVADDGEVLELAVGRQRDDVAGDHRRDPA
jgi:hypothetical protein